MGNKIDLSDVTECWTHEKQKEEENFNAFKTYLNNIWNDQKIKTTKIEKYANQIKNNTNSFKGEYLTKNFEEIKDKIFSDYFEDLPDLNNVGFFYNIFQQNLNNKNPCYLLSSLMLFTDYGKNVDKLYDNLLTLFQLFNEKEFNEKLNKQGKIDEFYLPLSTFDSSHLKRVIFFYVKMLSFYSIEYLNKVTKFQRYLNYYKRAYSNFIILKEYIDSVFRKIFTEKSNEVDRKTFVKIFQKMNFMEDGNVIRNTLEDKYNRIFDKEKIPNKK